MTSTRTTYILWFFFGWAGLHHLYLMRLNHAILWFATLGGGCGLGWIRDYWRIPHYIKWCSPDKALRKEFLRRVESKNKPECSKFREMGMVGMGSITAIALSALVPDLSDLPELGPVTYYFLLFVKEVLRVLGAALGVCLVANIGELKCTLFYPFVTSLCTIPLFYHTFDSITLASSITARVTSYKGIQWRHLESEPEKSTRKKTCTNVCLYLVACVTWLAIVSASFYLNGSITWMSGETVTGRECINKLLYSEAVSNLINSIMELFHLLSLVSPREILEPIWEYLNNKVTAYMTLGVFPGTDQEKISKLCRKMLAENHPDRFKGLREREEAEKKFLNIHKACSIVSSKRQQKTRGDDQ